MTMYFSALSFSDLTHAPQFGKNPPSKSRQLQAQTLGELQRLAPELSRHPHQVLYQTPGYRLAQNAEGDYELSWTTLGDQGNPRGYFILYTLSAQTGRLIKHQSTNCDTHDYTSSSLVNPSGYGPLRDSGTSLAPYQQAVLDILKRF